MAAAALALLFAAGADRAIYQALGGEPFSVSLVLRETHALLCLIAPVCCAA